MLKGTAIHALMPFLSFQNKHLTFSIHTYPQVSELYFSLASKVFFLKKINWKQFLFKDVSKTPDNLSHVLKKSPTI